MNGHQEYAFGTVGSFDGVVTHGQAGVAEFGGEGQQRGVLGVQVVLVQEFVELHQHADNAEGRLVCLVVIEEDHEGRFIDEFVVHVLYAVLDTELLNDSVKQY